MHKPGKKALIVGSGLGGLATALRLSSHGYEVDIVEKYHSAGGRLNQFVSAGFTFDIGPSFFSMSYEFDELFRSCGMQNPLKMRPLDPLYAVHFPESTVPYLIYKDIAKLAAQFPGEKDFGKRLEKYLREAGQLFHDTENIVIKSNFNSAAAYLAALARVPLKHAPKLFRTMWKELERTFNGDEARIIFSLVAFFLGATPFDTPAVYSLLSYTELVYDGYWNIEGGMYAIVNTLLHELEKRKVRIHYNREILGYEADRKNITAFTDHTGQKWSADTYVVNADAAAFRGQVMKRPAYTEEKLDKMDWTLAPFTIYLGVKGKAGKLHHHNYFLGNNFREYSDTIFRSTESPERPYYYVNVSSRSNPGCAPEGCENIFILCPVPDLRFKKDWRDRDELAERIINDLSSRIDFDLKGNTVTRMIMTPVEWQQSFNLYKGSGLGLAHGLNQVGGLRPKNYDEKYRNLFYTGASTTPGTGLPMVVISSRLVTQRILKHDGIVP